MKVGGSPLEGGVNDSADLEGAGSHELEAMRAAVAVAEEVIAGGGDDDGEDGTGIDCMVEDSFQINGRTQRKTELNGNKFPARQIGSGVDTEVVSETKKNRNISKLRRLEAKFLS